MHFALIKMSQTAVYFVKFYAWVAVPSERGNI
jgi:hypothetical protein